MKFNPARRKEDRGYRRIWSILARFFTIIGIASFISTIFISITLVRAMNYKPPALPDNILLVYKLKSNLSETTQKPSFKGPLLRPPTTLHEITESIDMAKKDDRVKGLIIDIDSTNYNLAQIQELRDAIYRFRETDKFTMVFADDIGSMSSYYLATSFEEIWMQPMGMVAITGMYSEIPFFKNLMDKIGVKADFDNRGKYKSAMESFTRMDMSKDNREMMTSIITDLSNQVISGIAKDRRIDEKEIRNLINNAPYIAEESLSNKLIDKLDYYDVMINTAKERVGEDVELIDLLGYGFGAKTEDGEGGMAGFFTQLWHKKDLDSVGEGKNKIALIYGAGIIMPHKESSSFMANPFVAMGQQTMFADKIAAAFHEAVKNDDISVIVFRIDSPGGAPGAAETLRRAVVVAQEKGKKVVVSMGGTAASGGYWAAVDADYIIAEPGSLTGSIGVFAGKMVLEDFWKKLDVTWDSVGFGDNSDMWSMNSGFSEGSAKRFGVVLDNIYDSFIKRVANGRNMTIEEVEKIAQGRVWTGRQAKEIGLVDDLGGLEYALSYAKELSGFDKDDDVPVLHYPTRKSTLELIFQMLTEGTTMVSPINKVNIPAEMQQIYSLWIISKLSKELTVISPIVAGFNLK